MPHQRYPKEIVLKDSNEVILKPVEADDLEKLVHFYQDMQFEFRWFLKEDPCDIDVVKKWIENQKAEKCFAILALYESRIVGHAALLLRLYGGRKHVGKLRTMVAPDFKGKQLGTWMVFDLTKRAMELGLEKIRCDFVIGVEDHAVKAFRNMDFVKEGLLKDYFRDEKGNYHDYQIMIKHLHKEFSDF